MNMFYQPIWAGIYLRFFNFKHYNIIVVEQCKKKDKSAKFTIVVCTVFIDVTLYNLQWFDKKKNYRKKKYHIFGLKNENHVESPNHPAVCSTLLTGDFSVHVVSSSQLKSSVLLDRLSTKAGSAVFRSPETGAHVDKCWSSSCSRPARLPGSPSGTRDDGCSIPRPTPATGGFYTER